MRRQSAAGRPESTVKALTNQLSAITAWLKLLLFQDAEMRPR